MLTRENFKKAGNDLCKWKWTDEELDNLINVFNCLEVLSDTSYASSLGTIITSDIRTRLDEYERMKQNRARTNN